MNSMGRPQTDHRMAMPDGAILHVAIDDFTDPWVQAGSIVFLHGLAESGLLWRAWSPAFSRRWRVIRPDHRGFGLSSPVSADFTWSLTKLEDDLETLLDQLELDSVHLVGAKIGGTLALDFAARRPERLLSVTAIGAPLSMVERSDQLSAAVAQIGSDGVESWVRETTAGRMGASMGEIEVQWWIDLMSRTPANTLLGFMPMVATIDVRPLLDQISIPTLLLTSSHGLFSPDELIGWQRAVPDKRKICVIDTDSYHLAASHPDSCTEIVVRFLEDVESGRSSPWRTEPLRGDQV
ncbi:alpha/beta fold hydrolase [Rhizorhabdus dicambivorans]|uniref:Alpha/beta hydrolase n=1 Tax=Rhizorhabdus dicambivorans TaxID=1850238 RepID=A0A2A4FXX0_9SPHN|nr:alpha/beta hydrolase [Rhizorhabdus dicambivorans]ATE64180.1 alpha/beta hydrolase [Rhizorhabdus dicambivorans]PCE42548.1 alpha/beta hydrolase [Rhizorhabdus dicambivorans]